MLIVRLPKVITLSVFFYRSFLCNDHARDEKRQKLRRMKRLEFPQRGYFSSKPQSLSCFQKKLLLAKLNVRSSMHLSLKIRYYKRLWVDKNRRFLRFRTTPALFYSIFGRLRQLLGTLLLVREVLVSIPGTLKSGTMSPTARPRCGVSS